MVLNSHGSKLLSKCVIIEFRGKNFMNSFMNRHYVSIVTYAHNRVVMTKVVQNNMVCALVLFASLCMHTMILPQIFVNKKVHGPSSNHENHKNNYCPMGI